MCFIAFLAALHRLSFVVRFFMLAVAVLRNDDCAPEGGNYLQKPVENYQWPEVSGSAEPELDASNCDV
jgi:hypothetical protein